MHVRRIGIKNILSFKDVEFRFDEYNVLVGANNSGKSNLIRILKMITKADNFDYFALNKNLKYDQGDVSQISIDLDFTNEETKLIVQTIFGKEVKTTEFPESIRNIGLIVNWNDLVSDQSQPNFTVYKFGNGITIIKKDSDQIVFHASQIFKKPQELDDFLDSIKGFSANQITNKVPSLLKLGEDNSIGNEQSFFYSFADGKKLDEYFTKEEKMLYTRLPLQAEYKNQSPERYAADILDYMKINKQANITVQLSALLARIFKNNIILIEESQPTYNQLTAMVFELKSTSDEAYDKLREGFSNIFNQTSLRVEKIDESNNRLFVIENGKRFPIDESASGHYALIRILYHILNKPNQIIVMDEPEVHFHPIKIVQLTQRFMELARESNNQIVVITHSPKFIDHRMLDKTKSNALTVVTRTNGESTVQTTPTDFKNHLKPQIFNPEVFFGKCTLIGEGPGDAFALKAISDHYGGLFEKHNITLMYCWGVGNVLPAIEIHNAFKIPFIALVDKEYDKDLTNVIKLQIDLEDEYRKLGWTGTGKLKENAYTVMRDILNQPDGPNKVEKSDIWKAVQSAIEKSDGIATI